MEQFWKVKLHRWIKNNFYTSLAVRAFLFGRIWPQNDARKKNLETLDKNSSFDSWILFMEKVGGTLFPAQICPKFLFCNVIPFGYYARTIFD